MIIHSCGLSMKYARYYGCITKNARIFLKEIKKIENKTLIRHLSHNDIIDKVYSMRKNELFPWNYSQTIFYFNNFQYPSCGAIISCILSKK